MDQNSQNIVSIKNSEEPPGLLKLPFLSSLDNLL